MNENEKPNGTDPETWSSFKFNWLEPALPPALNKKVGETDEIAYNEQFETQGWERRVRIEIKIKQNPINIFFIY